MQTLVIFHGVGNCDEPIFRLITFTTAVATARSIIQSIFDDNLSIPTAFWGLNFGVLLIQNHVLLGGCQTLHLEVFWNQ